ncbi:hypothetical protein LTR62_002768 [Meristemomyces frigidus]|uniref:Elongator complex protein 5 n=1 Tax=Meristemomyces frigidus TaxID=1508187 RepID=A0AAN7T7E4_9PEZI|nr:hypothetical protein LTR62_002768 [Meristemomyces frigidus]
MAPSQLQHRRTHNLLLINKLLSQRDAASPFTLLLDSLEQSARPLLTEYSRRAKTIQKPRDIDTLIPAWDLDVKVWQRQIAEALKERKGQRCLVIIDSINPLCATKTDLIPALLSAFITPSTSLLAIYHLDLVHKQSGSGQNPYAPSPLSLLKYLATTIVTMHSLHHVLARKAARDRSHAEPSFGLEEGKEGVLQSLGANSTSEVVLGMEHRRKSGRGVREWYCLSLPTPRARAQSFGSSTAISTRQIKAEVQLLEDHPQYRTPEQVADVEAAESGTTFELGLTEKQRRDREGVVLPYFDAQKGGGGEGGRILYDMGSEDDFDEDEDEI